MGGGCPLRLYLQSVVLSWDKVANICCDKRLEKNIFMPMNSGGKHAVSSQTKTSLVMGAPTSTSSIAPATQCVQHKAISLSLSEISPPKRDVWQ